jgi:hypothetical protein
MGKYDSYVLRVWRRAHAPSGQWVARLDHIQGHESQSFHDRDTLIAHLVEVLASDEDQGYEPGEVAEDKLGEKDQDDRSQMDGKSLPLADHLSEGSARTGRNIDGC